MTGSHLMGSWRLWRDKNDGLPPVCNTKKHKDPLSEHPNVVKGLCDLLQDIAYGQSLNARIVEPIILGFLNAKAHEVLGMFFKVGLKWTRAYICKPFEYVTSTSHHSTLDIAIWLGITRAHMAYQVAYLVKCYSIPPSLAVNTNQTSE